MSYVHELIQKEGLRQFENIELIASENFVSMGVAAAASSCLTNKYAEGYPGRRYYGGCRVVDEIEIYCQEQWKKVFNTDYHVNVQPHSGSNANMAAFASVLSPGDTILSLSLENGGHLAHGSPVNYSGKLYNPIFYGVNENGYIDYNDISAKLRIYHPKLILAGASAYARQIDFKCIHDILENYQNEYGVQVYFMVDMSHIAGLVAVGKHPSPFGYADIITTTTHKTLRGPRGGLIFCKPELAKKIDSAVFPGIQGGPLMHIIAAKAVCAEEDQTEDYKNYIRQVVRNANAMAEEFKRLGMDVVTGGTDTHMFLLDLSKTHPNVTGLMLQEYLDSRRITLNKNMVPNDKRKPAQTSGVRIGTPAMTTKGWKEDDFKQCARYIWSSACRLNEENEA